MVICCIQTCNAIVIVGYKLSQMDHTGCILWYCSEEH